MPVRSLTPTGERLLVALAELERQGTTRGHQLGARYPASATDLAARTGLGEGVQRHGSDNSPKAWSGTQSPGFVIGAAATALVRGGYARSERGHRSMHYYYITLAGRKRAAELVAEGVTAQGRRT